MKIEDLEKKISDRADAVVQAKIKAFKQEIDAALNKLFGRGTSGCESFGNYVHADTVTRRRDPRFESACGKLLALQIAVRDKVAAENPNHPDVNVAWPRMLWTAEQESIRNELLSKMDLMQQLLLTKERDTENDVPQQEAKPR